MAFPSNTGVIPALLWCGLVAVVQGPTIGAQAAPSSGTTTSGPAQQPPSQGNMLTGEAKINVIRSYEGAAPLPRPNNAIVYDFAIPEDAISKDNSMAERLHERHQSRQGNDADTSTETIAANLNSIFSKTLVNELGKITQHAERAATSDTPAPQHSMVVRGEFTGVSQGDRGKRILIGLGRGASNVEAHVTVTLLNGPQEIVLSEFTLKSGSGKKPGAAETMGAGGLAVGAATGSVSDKKETIEADTKRMAQAVAKEIGEIMKSQRWTGP